MKNKLIEYIALILVVITLYLNYLRNEFKIINLIVCALIIFFSFFYINKYLKKDRREKTCSLVFGILFSISMTLGKAIYNTHGLSCLFKPTINIITTIISLCGFSILGALFFSLILLIINKINSINIKLKIKRDSHVYLLLVVIIFCVYITALLAYYPGIYSYDMMHVNRQAIGQYPYDRFQPPLFTFIWALVSKLSNMVGLYQSTLYGIFQVLIVSLFFAYLLVFIRKRNYKVYLISCLFVIFNPVFAIFSIIPVKDVLFSVTFGMFVLLTYELFEKNSLPLIKTIFLLICIILSSLLRNNMIYVYIVLFVVLVILKKKLITKVLIIGIVLFYLVNGPVFNALGVKEGNSREKLSVPIEQMSLVVYRNNKNLDEDLKIEISKYFYDYDSIIELYNPRFADDVKELFASSYYDENKSDFWKLYFKLMKMYPNEYIVSFLDLNIPSWYLEADSKDEYANREYIETYIFENVFTRKTKTPLLCRYYENISYYIYFEKIPNIINIFSISYPIWFMILSFIIALYKKNYEKLLCILPMILLWATYLLGPVSNCRYMLPFMMLYPFLLFRKNENNKIKI